MQNQSGSADGYNPQAAFFQNPYAWNPSAMITPHRPMNGSSMMDTPSSSDESGIFNGSCYSMPGSMPHPFYPSSGSNQSSPEEEQKPSGGGKIRRKNNKTDIAEGVLEVQGRLSIVNNQRAYKVTAEELNRRVLGPEKMGCSALSAMCRNSKVSGCGEKFRNQLKEMGVNVDTNKRKAMEPTSFTALSEQESIQISVDLDVQLQTDFPTQHLAAKLLEHHSMAEMPQILEQFKIAAIEMQKLQDILNNVQVPLGHVRKENITATGPLQDGMERISALTHGFIMRNMKAWNRTFTDTFRHAVCQAEMQLGRPLSYPNFNPQYQQHWDPNFHPHPMMVPQMPQMTMTPQMVQPQMGQPRMWHSA